MSIKELEEALDRTYELHPLPHPNRTLATWYCLVASEDMQRNLFTDMAADWPLNRIVFYLDKYKYSLRYALSRIAREANDRTTATVPRKIISKLYIAAAKLMIAGIDYALASQLCGALHTGSATCKKDPDAWRITIDERHHDKAYGALELMGVGRPIELTFGALLFHWIRGSADVPEVVKRIAETVKIKSGLVSYVYSQELAVELASEMPQLPVLIPQQWKFSWGDRKQTTLLLNSLYLRCAYHIVAVHFGAGINGLKGGGASSLVLVLPLSQLIDDIELLSSLKRGQIERFIKELTLGFGTISPDPALQPIISLGRNEVALPCMHFLTSHPERNLLSLMARKDRVAFDEQSSLFEIDMTEKLESSAGQPGILMIKNGTFTRGSKKEEIDVLLVDEHARRLLVCELRWMLPPGDPREVQNRKSECLRKVEQLRRKVAAISAAPLDAVSKMLGRTIENLQGSEWVTNGVVLIAGYGGMRSPDPDLPIIPVELFEQALQRAPSLEALSRWCLNLSWLPQEGKHFNIVTMKNELADSVPLIVQGMEVTDSPLGFISDALSALK